MYVYVCMYRYLHDVYLYLYLCIYICCRTSADLFKTVFDLLVSVTVFVGRFDMRMMQVQYLSIYFLLFTRVNAINLCVN